MRRLRIAALAAAAALLLAGSALAQQPSAAAASAPAFGSLPLQRDDSRAAGLGWREAFGAAMVFGVLGVALHSMRRRAGAPRGAWWAGKNAPGSLRSGQAVRLTQAVSLHAVQWQGEELLLACTPTSVTVVARRSGANGGPNTEPGP